MYSWGLESLTKDRGLQVIYEEEPAKVKEQKRQGQHIIEAKIGKSFWENEETRYLAM